jgi:hypothetical protein
LGNADAAAAHKGPKAKTAVKKKRLNAASQRSISQTALLRRFTSAMLSKSARVFAGGRYGLCRCASNLGGQLPPTDEENEKPTGASVSYIAARGAKTLLALSPLTLLPASTPAAAIGTTPLPAYTAAVGSTSATAAAVVATSGSVDTASASLQWWMSSVVGYGSVKMGLPGMACQILFAAPMEVMSQIKKTKAVGQLPLLPYSSMVLNGAIWMTYGAIVSDKQ